jgi:hypothetical protein
VGGLGFGGAQKRFLYKFCTDCSVYIYVSSKNSTDHKVHTVNALSASRLMSIGTLFT